MSLQHMSSVFWFTLVALLFSGCSEEPDIVVLVEPASIRSDGEQILDIERQFVTTFTHRHSGQPNNLKARSYLLERMTDKGWSCSEDRWQIVNYSQPLELGNVICRLGPDDAETVLVVAHHDQFPGTVEGADNDGSGVAIMLHLAEIFSTQQDALNNRSLEFLFSDGEEYGMLGSLRYVQTLGEHEKSRLVAAISLDNVGKRWADGLRLFAIGQFRGYGALWLQRAAHQAAAAIRSRFSVQWVPPIPTWFDQLLGQMVPVSFMDQGPFVAVGIPAVGFALGYSDPQAQENHWQTYHHPDDRIEHQSAVVLAQTSRATESLLRHLLMAPRQATETLPYFSDKGGEQSLRGWPIVLLCLLPALIFAGVAWRNRKYFQWEALVRALVLPAALFAGVASTWLWVKAGWMLDFHLYPATSRDPEIYAPRWPAVLGTLTVIAAVGWGGWQLTPAARFHSSRVISLAIIAVSLAGLLMINPLSIILALPCLVWLAIDSRRSLTINWLLFFLGGTMVYLLIYQFGFVRMKNDLAILWFLLMMFAAKMIAPLSAVLICLITGSGMTLAASDRHT